MHRPPRSALLALATSAPVLAAALPAPRPVPATVPPDLRLVGETLEGELRPIPFSELPLADPRAAGVHLVRAEGFPRDGRAPDGELAEVTLADGDLLRGHVTGGEGEFVAVEIRGGVVLALSIEELSSVVVPGHLPRRLDEPLVAPEEGDRLYRRTGASLDRIDGTVVGFAAEGVRFDSVLGTKLFPWGEVAALYVEVLEEPAAELDEGEVPVELDLVDGSRLRGRLVEVGVQGVRLRVGSSGSAVLLGWEHVDQLFVDDGKLGFLSALEPVEERGSGTPFDDGLGMSWPARRDLSVVGGPLVAGGTRFSRGVGMHAPSVVAWSLDPRWDELRGLVAIDDSSRHNAENARGSVVFRLHLDGELVWESPVLRGGDGPRPLPPLALGPAAGDGSAPRLLELEVDPVDDFRGDRADWLRMVLVDR